MGNMMRLTLQKPESPADELQVAIDAFYRRCQAKNLSQHTIEFYKYRLEAFQRFMTAQYNDVPLDDITPAIIRDFLANEKSRISAGAADDSFVSLRVLFRYLVREGFVEDTPMTRVERPKQKKVVIAAFTSAQVEAMLGTCKSDFNGVRNRAIILILLDCGLRVSELCGITLGDFDWSELTVLVTGKGDKERIVPFGHTARSALLTYLERRGDIPKMETFFLTCYGDPMGRYAVLRALKECGTRASVSGVRVSPHTFRHTCAVMYLRNGGDVFSLQKLLGHTDLTMTRRYAELTESDVVKKHRLYSPADAIRAPTPSGRKRMR